MRKYKHVTPRYSHALCHFGVKGMKWGVRKKEESTSKNNHSKSSSEKKDYTKIKRIAKIGAAVAGTALVAYGGYKLHQTGAFDKLTNKGSTIISSISSPTDKLTPSLSPKDREISSVIKTANPYKGTDGGSYNCVSSCLATGLRMMGFSVEALPSEDRRSFGGSVEFLFKNTIDSMGNSVVKSTPASRITSASDMASRLQKKYGDGAFGGIRVPLKSDNTGHAFNWKNEGGKTKFFDGSRAVEDASPIFKHVFSGGNIEYARFDNLEINESNIFDYVKQRKK